MHYFHQIKIVVILFAQLSLSLAADQTKLETVGLAPGQTADQVTKAIKDFDKNLGIRKVTCEGSKVIPESDCVLYAVSPVDIQWRKQTNKYGDYLQVTFGQTTKKSYFVVRRSGELSMEKVAVQDLIKTLTDKFGQPTKKPSSSMPLRMEWTYKSDGSPDPTGECQHPDLTNFFVAELLNTRVREDCGVTVMASIISDSKHPTFSYLYQVAIFSHQDYLAEAKEQKRLTDESNAAQDAKDKAEKTAKPRI